MKTKIHAIKVSALGYDAFTLEFVATNKKEAMKSEKEAIDRWLEENDLDNDSRGLASVTYSTL